MIVCHHHYLILVNNVMISSLVSPPSAAPPPRASSSQCTSRTGTSSRPQLYLLGNHLPEQMPTGKLPKNMHILSRFITLFIEKDPKSKEEKGKVAKLVSNLVAEELKNYLNHLTTFVSFVMSGETSIETGEFGADKRP